MANTKDNSTVLAKCDQVVMVIFPQRSIVAG